MGRKLVLVLTLLVVVGLWAGSSAATGKPSAIANTLVDAPSAGKSQRSEVVTLSPSRRHVPLSPDSIELFYDDGVAETFWWIQAPSGPSDYMAVVFDPPAAPYTILSGRIYGRGGSVTTFAECLVTPGTASVPDYTNPYAVAPNEPVMPGTADWVYVDFTDTVINNTDPLWLLVHWPNASADGPYVGGDQTAPDSRSYWTLDASTWNLWTGDDFMMRVSIDVLFQYGAIEGTVSELGGGPIQDAIVTADGYVDTTDVAGYYFMDVTTGTYDVTASAVGYNSVTVPGVVVAADDTVTVDFDLPYPLISVDPTSFYVVLAPDTFKDTTLYIYNTGNGRLDFDIDILTHFSINAEKSARPPGETFSIQITGSVDPSATDARYVKSEPKARPKAAPAFGDILSQFNAPWGDTYAGAGLAYDPNTGYLWAVNQASQTMYEIDPVAQTVISTWAIPLGLPWGCGFDGSEVWISDPTITYDDYEFTTFGAGPLDQFTPIYTSWAADMAFDGTWLWQIDVGSPGAVYQYDFDGNPLDTIQPGYSISQRGLACNRDQGTWYCGSWNNPTGQLWEFDDAGATVNYLVTGLAISGLAWDGVTGAIWCMTNSDPDVIYELDSGYPPPATWLDASPRSDTVSAGDTFAVTVTFDSDGLVPGIYTGELSINNNSINDPVIVPCTLEVVLVGVEEAGRRPGLPRVHALSQSSPNPMRAGPATISYQVAAEGDVSLKIYNAAGRLVNTLVAGSLEPGYYKEIWDGRDSSEKKVPSGVYFCRLSIGSFEASRKMVVLR